jgi:hypothetical protein
MRAIPWPCRPTPWPSAWPLDFDAERREGILATSPLRVARPDLPGTALAKPRRIGFLFSAASEAALERLRREFPLKEPA